MFTWQFARGVVLFAVASACAYPMALFYEQPQLEELVPFGSLAVLLLGLRSTAYYTLRRKLNLMPLMLVEVASGSKSHLELMSGRLVRGCLQR